MKAARVLQYGPPSVITRDDVPQPEPGAGQLLIRVEAAGVGNWDALIRAGKVKLEPLPLILGAEIAGIVEATEPRFRGSSQATKCTAPRTGNSAGHMPNMQCRSPE